MNPEPFRLCPRYDSCSVNACPLDSHYATAITHPLDRERKCPMEKPVRVRIAASFPNILAKNGLTNAEWAAKQTYDRKPVAVKLAMAQRGKETLKRLRN